MLFQVLQSRFVDKLLKFSVLCPPKRGTALLKGLTITDTTFVPGTLVRVTAVSRYAQKQRANTGCVGQDIAVQDTSATFSRPKVNIDQDLPAETPKPTPTDANTTTNPKRRGQPSPQPRLPAPHYTPPSPSSMEGNLLRDPSGSPPPS